MDCDSECQIYNGYLFKRGHIVKSWRRRYFELLSDKLIYSKFQGGKALKHFPIGSDTICEDSKLRPFCFRIATDGNELFLFARNITEKDSWADAIHSAIQVFKIIKIDRNSSILSLQTKMTQRVSLCTQEIEKVKKKREQRPQIFVRIIQARNLIGNNLNGPSVLYTRVMIGSNVVDTQTVSKELNPCWGEVFTFDFDRSLRFAKIEIWERDSHKKNDFLGMVLIPLANVGAEKIRKWHQLGKRNERSHIKGEIEIEMFTNVPKSELLLTLFKRVLTLSEVSNGTSRSNETGYCGTDVDEPFFFPKHVPPNEFIEDISVNCLLKSHQTSDGLFSCGFFLLTNYRIIFVSKNRLQTGSDEDILLNPIQITTMIPIGLISSVASVRDINTLGTGMNLPAIKVKTRDGRFVSFLFYQKNQSAELCKAIKSFVYQSESESTEAQLLRITQISAIGSSLSNFFINSQENLNYSKSISRDLSSIDQDEIEFPLSEEGPSHSRIFLRLHFRIINPQLSVKICIDAQSEYLRQFQNIFLKDVLIAQDHMDDYGKICDIDLNDSESSERIDSSDDEENIRQTLEQRQHQKDQQKIIKTQDDLLVVTVELRKWIDTFDDNFRDESNKGDDPADDDCEYEYLTADNGQTISIKSPLNDDSDDNYQNINNNQLSKPINTKENESTTIEASKKVQFPIISSTNTKKPANGQQNGQFTFGPEKFFLFEPIRENSKEGSTNSSESILQEILKRTIEDENDSKVLASKNENISNPDNSNSIFAWKTNDKFIFGSENISSNQTNETTRQHFRSDSSYSNFNSNNLSLSQSKSICDTEFEDSSKYSSVLKLSKDNSMNLSYNQFKPVLGSHNWWTLDDSKIIQKNSKLYKEGWHIFNQEEDFARLGIPDERIRITTINAKYGLCSTYPKLLAVPTIINDKQLQNVAKFRSRQRIPVIVWRHPHTKATISRCSQPLVGIQQSRNENDELLIEALRSCSGNGNEAENQDLKRIESEINSKPLKPSIPLIIIDARPKKNATANQIIGKGYEGIKGYPNSQIMFMDIQNIHSMRRSVDQMEEACQISLSSHQFLQQVINSQWLSHIHKVLISTLRVVHLIAVQGISCLLHCSDGWDRTAQLSALAQLLMDPYYRTLRGFQILIEKEWLHFGHKFDDRKGIGNNQNDRAPIFHQFLDCVHQILIQYPNKFEFNQELLLFLVEHSYSDWFGTFMCNSVKEREDLDLEHKTLSIWTYINYNSSRFINPNFVLKIEGNIPNSTGQYYELINDLILPIVSLKRLKIWDGWFFWWHDRISAISWLKGDQMLVDADRSPVFWQVDRDVNQCGHCLREFTFYRRRHHCRNCGKIFCETCCQNFSIIEEHGNLPVRICDVCAHDSIANSKIHSQSAQEPLVDKNQSVNLKFIQKEEEERDIKILDSLNLQPVKIRTPSSSLPPNFIVQPDNQSQEIELQL